MVIQQGYFADTDALRNDMTAYHPEIKLVDFEIYSLGAFNECYNRNGILAVVDCWEHVHPLMKVIPVEWEYQMSYGLLYSREPAPHVRDFLEIVKRIQQDNDVGYEPHGIC
jgi:hypothetical protein